MQSENHDHTSPLLMQSHASTTPELILQAYSEMVRARTLDAKAITLYKQNKCHFQIGVAGHEAVQVGFGLVFRPGVDWFYPYYRDMALCAALGMTDGEFCLNFMNKSADPNSHGRQMPMHYGHRALQIVSQSSPTGTQFLQSVGCALASRFPNKDEVTYVSAGEGTCAQGDFHESLNWAARDKLPLVFLIQNNNYAISVHVSEQLAGKSVYKLAANYENLAREEIDGTNFFESVDAARRAHARALRGEGPTVIEAHVPRLQSHSISDNHLKYREPEDIEREASRCPLLRLRQYILSSGIASTRELEDLEAQIRQNVDRAALWAEAQEDCDPELVSDHTLTLPDPALELPDIPVPDSSKPAVFLVDALNHALHEELSHNPNTLVFGQDVAGGKGGVFTVTSGLTASFGEARVFNTQLAESSIIGVAVGLATRGLKPIAEIQFGDYVWTGMMQIRNELAMMSYRSAGDFTAPAVIRIPVGGYIHGGAYHSQNIEATFAHFPGLFVIYPANASDAKGLLKSAIRGKNPVLFLEHKGLYRQPHAKGVEGDSSYLVPIGKAKVVREGDDLTIVTWGFEVQRSMQAAAELAKEGYSTAVIDLRTIVPLDIDLVVEYVKRTSRVLVVHEDVTFMGFGAEIAAQLADLCFSYLDAPIRRVGMKYAAHVGHAPSLEAAVLPQVGDIIEAARGILRF